MSETTKLLSPGEAKIVNASLLALLVGFVIWTSYQELQAYHFFYGDDWDWLYKAEFYDYYRLFSFKPRAVYNDRPVGAVAIKAIYDLAGLRHEYFQYLQLLVHCLNAFLLFLIAKPYIGRLAALNAAALAAAWIVANSAVYWTAAIFDLLGATLCLLSIWLWQKSKDEKFGLLYNIAGAMMYFLAIRTKEFALGLPALMFLMGLTLEKKPVARVLKELSLYIAVMLVLAGRYAYLMHRSSFVGGQSDAYSFDYGGLPSNFWFYFSRSFYSDLAGIVPAILAGAIFIVAGIVSPQYRRHLAVGLGGFIILLGPTLLLTNHLEVLYLYAPHFFLAFAIAALFPINVYGNAAALALTAALVAVPAMSGWHANVLKFYDNLSSKYEKQLAAFFQVKGNTEPGAKFYISGLEPHFNTFAFGPGHSVKIKTHDPNLTVIIDKPKDELVAQFCADKSPKYFIAYDGVNAKNETVEILDSCRPENRKPPH